MAADTSDLHHGNYERVACLIFIVLAPFFLFTRFWSRILAKQVGSDDWAALAACVSYPFSTKSLKNQLQND
jgi:hypothetical protein